LISKFFFKFIHFLFFCYSSYRVYLNQHCCCDYSESNRSAAEAIMTSVRDTVATYPFQFEHHERQVRILSGIDEGTFGWIATNYLSGNFGVRSSELVTL